MRKWTPEQREKHSQALRAFHARRRRGRVVVTRPGRTARAVELTMADLPKLIEAHELVDRIGWKLARELARRMV